MASGGRFWASGSRFFDSESQFGPLGNDFDPLETELILCRSNFNPRSRFLIWEGVNFYLWELILDLGVDFGPLGVDFWNIELEFRLCLWGSLIGLWDSNSGI